VKPIQREFRLVMFVISSFQQSLKINLLLHATIWTKKIIFWYVSLIYINRV